MKESLKIIGFVDHGISTLSNFKPMKNTAQEKRKINYGNLEKDGWCSTSTNSFLKGNFILFKWDKWTLRLLSESPKELNKVICSFVQDMDHLASLIEDNKIDETRIERTQPQEGEWKLVSSPERPERGTDVLTVTEDKWYRIFNYGSQSDFPSQVVKWMYFPETI